METSVLLAGAAAMLPQLVALVVVLLVLRARRGTLAGLEQARVETAELRAQVAALSERLERHAPTMVRLDDPAIVITDAGATSGGRVPASRRLAEPNVSDSMVLSATFGEPLVKVVAFGHGLRRALSAESRNTIRFEMRRELRRARKQRRREMKQAWRRMQAEERASYDEQTMVAS